ncbi:MAG: PQQ-binding-like beta-propeller repeat protein, partial [Armatimonadota bacterium]
WSYLPQGIVEGYFGSPVIDGTGNIFFTARDASYTTYLFAIDPSGNEIWKTKPSHAIVASPAIGLGGEIYTFGTAITCLVPESASVVVMAVGISSLLALRRRSAL